MDINQTVGRVLVLWNTCCLQKCISHPRMPPLQMLCTLFLKPHSAATSCSSSASQADYIYWITWKEIIGDRGYLLKKRWETRYIKIMRLKSGRQVMQKWENREASMIISPFSTGLGILSLSLRCPLYVPTLCEYLTICSIFYIQANAVILILWMRICTMMLRSRRSVWLRTNVSPNFRTLT